MLTKKIVLAVSCLLCLSFVTAVQASDESTKSMYLAVKGGVFLPNSDSSGLKYFDNGYNGEAAFGLRLTDYLGLELGAGYYVTEAKDAAPGNTKDKFTTIPLTANAIFTIPLGSAVNLFAGGGAGYYLSTFKPGGGDKWSGNAFGYQALAGVDFNLGQRFSLGAEYKYLKTKPEFEHSGVKFKAEVGGSMLDAGIKLRF